MTEFREGQGDPVREDWEKYPMSMRFQRLEALADLSVRLRAYTFGGVDYLASEETIASTKNLLADVRKDEAYMPAGILDVLERYEMLTIDTGDRTPEKAKAAETILRNIAEIIDGEYTGVLAAAKTASQEDLRQSDILAVTDVPAAARRDLQYLKESITNGVHWLSHFSWQLEPRRQRLVADGLRYERAHPEAKGETAKANAPWFLLQNALLASEHDEMDDAKKGAVLARIEECEALVDLIEGREE